MLFLSSSKYTYNDFPLLPSVKEGVIRVIMIVKLTNRCFEIQNNASHLILSRTLIPLKTLSAKFAARGFHRTFQSSVIIVSTCKYAVFAVSELQVVKFVRAQVRNYVSKFAI